ncbi:MAG: hypothetical protein C5S38_02180 [Candidatus Methanophagaceae archaeon]|nr:MAG: hypothetical protein C5S38_02180 [Methanophagales archaeon]
MDADVVVRHVIVRNVAVVCVEIYSSSIDAMFIPFVICTVLSTYCSCSFRDGKPGDVHMTHVHLKDMIRR